MTNLTKEVIKIKKGCGNIEKTVNDMCLYVYSFVKRKSNMDEDMQNDFIVYFYPRLKRMIDTFTFNGTPFEYFMNVHLKFQLKTFIRKNKERKLSNLITSNAAFTSEIFGTPYTLQAKEDCVELPYTEITSQVMRKRLIIALLKSYFHFDEENISQIAAFLGYPFEWVRECILEIKKRNEKRRLRFTSLRSQRNAVFSKMFTYQERLRVSCCKEEKGVYRVKIQKYTNTLHRLAKELKAVTIAPSHRELSEIMRIPKGTIDSSMYYLKNTFLQETQKKKAA